MSADEYLNLPRDPQTWIIKGIIPTGGSINIYGSPKAGKSFLALGMAHAISSGQSHWLDFPVLKHGPVMYLQADTARGVWSEYLTDVRDSGYDMNGVWIADHQLFPQKPFNITLPQSFDWLKAQVQIIKPVVVFLDVLRELFRGDENDSDVMSNVMGQMRLATAGSAFGIISHAKKPGKEQFDDLMGDNRGSGYVAGAVDVVMKVTPKHLNYAGRSKFSGTLDVVRLDNGLHSLDPEDQRRKLQLHLAVQDAINTLDGKKLNVSQVARDYAERVCESAYDSDSAGCKGLSGVTAGRHVKAYLEQHNLTRHLGR